MRKEIKYWVSDDRSLCGAFLIDPKRIDTRTFFIAHNPNGWWYWDFDADKDDIGNIKAFTTEKKYVNRGFSSGCYSTLEELFADENFNLTEKQLWQISIDVLTELSYAIA